MMVKPAHGVLSWGGVVVVRVAVVLRVEEAAVAVSCKNSARGGVDVPSVAGRPRPRGAHTYIHCPVGLGIGGTIPHCTPVGFMPHTRINACIAQVTLQAPAGTKRGDCWGMGGQCLRFGGRFHDRCTA